MSTLAWPRAVRDFRRSSIFDFWAGLNWLAMVSGVPVPKLSRALRVAAICSGRVFGQGAASLGAFGSALVRVASIWVWALVPSGF